MHRVPWVPILATVGVALALFHPALNGKVLGGHVSGTPPYEAAPPPGANRLLIDVETVIQPFLCHVTRSLRAGEIPLWNPYSGCGAPFLANEQSAVLHPFTVLGTFVPWRYALLVICFLRWATAFGGTVLLARQLGIPGAGALVAAASFSLSGCIVTYLPFPVGGVLAHLPLVLALALRAAGRPSMGASLALAGALVSSVLAGHFEYLPFLWAAAAMPWIARRPAPSRGPAVAVFAGALLGSSVVLLPSIEYLTLSVALSARGAHGTTLGGLRAFLNVLFFALPAPRSTPELQALGPSNSFLLLLPSTYYIGIAASVLSLGALSHPSGRRLWSVAIAWSLLLFDNPASRIVWSIPPLPWVHPDKLVVGLHLALSLAAGVAIAELRRTAWVAAARAVAVLALPLLLMHPVLARMDPPRDLLPGVVVAVVGALAMRMRTARLETLALLLIATIAGERGHALAGTNPWQRPSEIFAEMPGVQTAERLASHERVAAARELFFPNLALVFRLRDTRLYDGLRLRSHDDFVAAADGSRGHVLPLVPSVSTRLGGARVIIRPVEPVTSRLEQRDASEPLELRPGQSVSQALGQRRGFFQELSVAFGVPTSTQAGCVVALRTPSPGGSVLWSARLGPREVPAGGWLTLRPDRPLFLKPDPIHLVVTAEGTPDERLAIATGAAPSHVARAFRGTERLAGAIAYAISQGDDAIESVGAFAPGIAIGTDRAASHRARLENDPGSAIEYVQDAAHDVTLRFAATGDDRLVLADNGYPGWLASLDGRRAPIESLGPFRAVRVGAGPHLLTFTFRPWSYRLGLFLSLVALSVAQGALLAARRPLGPAATITPGLTSRSPAGTGRA
ncbi:MAG: hypothetical protein U0166_26385 [Acidobacteriota bacterium]